MPCRPKLLNSKKEEDHLTFYVKLRRANASALNVADKYAQSAERFSKKKHAEIQRNYRTKKKGYIVNSSEINDNKQLAKLHISLSNKLAL